MTEVTMLRMNPTNPMATTVRQHPQLMKERAGACRHERLILDIDQRWAHCPDCDSEWKEAR